MEKPLRTFLTEQNIALHKDYLKKLRLRYSILEKSVPEISGAELRDIPRLKIKSTDREEALSLKSNIIAHEIYFSSFAENPSPCPVICKEYGSERGFIYDVFKSARGRTQGFLFIALDARHRPMVYFSDTNRAVIAKYKPLLAIDLCEHASFLDYGFEHDRYIENACAHLNFAKINECVKSD